MIGDWQRVFSLTNTLENHMSTLPPPGRLFDVGGYRLHMQCNGSGSPAVVMDSGLTGNSILWANTLPLIGEFTRACAFDRAGYAWSDPAPAGLSRASRQIVAELRTVLKSASIPPPYILAGHSFGAINMLAYAYQHPQEVAGLLLVDPSHPEMFERVPKVPSPEAMARSFKVIIALGRIGLLRWLGPALVKRLLPDGKERLPSGAWEALVTFASHPKEYQTAQREAQSGRESFALARGGPGSLGDLPLEVLSADWWVSGKKSAMKEMIFKLREEQAALSSHGRHHVVSGCDHANLPVLRPDAVAESVNRILQECRKTPIAL
jgi:pimeloyl-ACP methyl ester carboxylesterase